MIYDNILTKEELEALLTPEELEVFIAEQEGDLKHERVMSPAHLLLALRELEDTVARLTARIEQLEQRGQVNLIELEPMPVESLSQALDDRLTELPVQEAEYFEDTYLETYIEQQEYTQYEQQAEVLPEQQPAEQEELQTESLEELQAAEQEEILQNESLEELQADQQEVLLVESLDELQGEEIEELQDEELDESATEEQELIEQPIAGIEDATNEIPAAAASEDTSVYEEVSPIMQLAVDSTSYGQDSGLISRSARHRERKPSILSRLLK